MSFGRSVRSVAFIAKQDLRQLLRERETLIWVFIMPVVFFYFIGTITGGMAEPSSRTEYIALDAPGEPGILAEQLARRLTEQDFQVERPDEAGLFRGNRRADEFHRRLILPADFTARIGDLEPSVLRFEREDGGIANDFDSFRITRAVYGLLADLVALGANGFDPVHPEFAAKLAELDQMERSITLEVKPAGKRQVIPSGFDQAIPGILVMFILMQGLTGTAVLLVVERRLGLLRRLAAVNKNKGHDERDYDRPLQRARQINPSRDPYRNRNCPEQDAPFQRREKAEKSPPKSLIRETG